MTLLARMVLVTVLLMACGGGSAETTQAPPAGAESALAAVEGLLDALRRRDFDAASDMIAPGQMTLVFLVEGGSVVDATSLDEQEIARNFWAAFADALGPQSLAQLAPLGGAPSSFVVREVEFAAVPVAMIDESRSLVARRTESGWKVDVLASFAAVIGSRYAPAIERALTSPEASLLEPDLVTQKPSFEAVLQLPGITGSLQQAMLLSVELLGG
jgi:hypothetical protein